MSFWIVTDACCDLPVSYIKSQERLMVVPMSYQIDSDVREIDPLDDESDQKGRAFYQKLLGGSHSTTFQINEQTWLDHISPLCGQGDDVLVLAFSSGLSGTHASAEVTVAGLRQQFPDRKVYVVDSLAASLGEGLIVHQVLSRRAAGEDIDACYAFAQEIVQKVLQWFTVDDLHFLRRGGRVSATSAYLGSILKIKPILNVNPRGKLIPREKVQGRKRSLRALFEKAEEYAYGPEKQTMFISHGDCLDDAMWLAGKLKKDLRVPQVVVSMIGPIVGSHSGPGTVALFFMGKDGAGRLDGAEE